MLYDEYRPCCQKNRPCCKKCRPCCQKPKPEKKDSREEFCKCYCRCLTAKF